MFKKILGAVATAAIALGATSAQAVSLATADFNSSNNTFMGTYTTAPTTQTFTRSIATATNPVGFNDYWVFELASEFVFSVNLNWLDPVNFSSIDMQLYNVDGGVTGCTNIGDSCTASVGSKIADAAPSNLGPRISESLAAGYYMIRIYGNTTADENSYSGNTRTSVPEPATMGLFGLGLAAVGFVRRRRIAA